MEILLLKEAREDEHNFDAFKFRRTKEEILLANRELLNIRRGDLTALFARDLAAYESELSLKDLALDRNRI